MSIEPFNCRMCKATNRSCSVDAFFEGIVAMSAQTVLPRKQADRSSMDYCGLTARGLFKMQSQQLLMLH